MLFFINATEQFGEDFDEENSVDDAMLDELDDDGAIDEVIPGSEPEGADDEEEEEDEDEDDEALAELEEDVDEIVSDPFDDEDDL